MDVYIYQADIYCADCAWEIRLALEATTGAPPLDLRDNSEFWPQGPYLDGGGEADCPQHCGGCGEFLGNPLTGAGYEYVLDALRDGAGDEYVLAEWLAYYGDDLFRNPLVTINDLLDKEE